jgi:hypothetical protein
VAISEAGTGVAVGLGVGVGLTVGDALAVAVAVADAVAALVGLGAAVEIGDSVRRMTFSTAFSTFCSGAGTFSPHATSTTARTAKAARLLTEQGCYPASYRLTSCGSVSNCPRRDASR